MLSPFNFAGPARIAAEGSTLYYQSSSAALTGADPRLQVTVDGQLQGVMYPGDVLRLPEPGRVWALDPVSASPELAGVVMIGVGSIIPGMLAGGPIGVLDQSAAQTLAGEQFMGGMSRTAAAANFPNVGVVNPAASGQRVIVRRARLNVSANGIVRMWTALGQSTSPITQTAPKNKRMAYPNAQARICAHDSTTSGGTAPSFAPAELTSWDNFGYMRVSTSHDLEIPYSTPIIIDPGAGLYFQADTAASVVSIFFELEEVPV